jgi:hypothetical protein
VIGVEAFLSESLSAMLILEAVEFSSDSESSFSLDRSDAMSDVHKPVSNCSDKKPPSTMFGQVFTPKIESDKHALKETKLKVTTSEVTFNFVSLRACLSLSILGVKT